MWVCVCGGGGEVAGVVGGEWGGRVAGRGSAGPGVNPKPRRLSSKSYTGLPESVPLQ